MFASSPSIAVPVIHAIEDAVLFGNIKEIDGILDMVKDDLTFPDNIRYALEALMFWRIYYGKGCVLEPSDEPGRQKLAYLESSWGREVIEMLGHYPDLTEAKYA